MEMEEFAGRIAHNVRRIFPSLPPPKPYYPDEEEEDN
jgi:TatD DNase family protein